METHQHESSTVYTPKCASILPSSSMRALDLLLRYRRTLSRYDTLEEETSQVLAMEGRKLTDKDMSSYWRF